MSTPEDPASRLAAGLGISRTDAKTMLFHAVYSANPEPDLNAYVDALLKEAGA